MSGFARPALGAILLMAAGCASPPQGRVVRAENGPLAAIGVAGNKTDARLKAIDAAKESCARSGGAPVFRPSEIRSHEDADAGLGPQDYPMIAIESRGERPQVTVFFRCEASPTT